MSTCCTETEGQCCGGAGVATPAEPATRVAQAPSQKSHGCCGGGSKATH